MDAVIRIPRTWYYGTVLVLLIGLLCAGCVGDYING